MWFRVLPRQRCAFRDRVPRQESPVQVYQRRRGECHGEDSWRDGPLKPERGFRVRAELFRFFLQAPVTLDLPGVLCRRNNDRKPAEKVEACGRLFHCVAQVDSDSTEHLCEKHDDNGPAN